MACLSRPAGLRTVLLAVLAAGAGAASASATSMLGANFAGPSLSTTSALVGYSYAPPDMAGAVGGGRVAQFINGAFTVYDRTGATVTPSVSDATFWANAGVGSAAAPGVSDTRLLFDTDSQRWFAAQINLATSSNQILLAVSNTADPSAGFKGVSFVANSASGHFADQPTLGIDRNGIYVGTSNFAAAGGYVGTSSLFSIPKADLLQAAPSLGNMTRFEDRPAPAAPAIGFEPDPVINMAGTGGHVIAIDDVSFGLIDRTNIVGAGGPNATLSPTTRTPVAFDSFPGLARQPDGTRVIDAGDNRINTATYEANGLIYVARTIGETNQSVSNTRALIDFSVVDAVTGAVRAESVIGDTSYDYYYGAIAADAAGTFLLTYTRSGGAATGSAGNISSFAEICRYTAGTIACDAPLLLSQGAVSDYHLFGDQNERWGDYSAAAIDPQDPNSFWAFTEVPRGTANWGTQISQILTTIAVPEPASWLLLAFGLAGLVATRSRRGKAAAA